MYFALLILEVDKCPPMPDVQMCGWVPGHYRAECGQHLRPAAPGDQELHQEAQVGGNYNFLFYSRVYKVPYILIMVQRISFENSTSSAIAIKYPYLDEIYFVLISLNFIFIFKTTIPLN